MFSFCACGSLMTAQSGPMGSGCAGARAADGGQRVHGGARLRRRARHLFQLVHDAGRTFSAPVKVAEAAIVPLTRHRGPRIVFCGRRDRDHGGRRQHRGGGRARARPALGRRSGRVALDRRRKDAGRRGR